MKYSKRIIIKREFNKSTRRERQIDDILEDSVNGFSDIIIDNPDELVSNALRSGVKINGDFFLFGFQRS